MDIPALSMAMAQSRIATDFSTGVLKMSMDTVEASSDMMKQMMELSVNPDIGSSIDISV